MAKWGEIKCPRCEELEAKLKTSEEIGRAFEEDAGQLRAKLEKAVEAMQFWSEAVEPDVDKAIALMGATLAELTGGKDA